MTTENKNWDILKKKYGLFIAIIILFAIFGATYLVCTLEYNNQKKNILAEQEEALVLRAARTVGAMALWADGLDSQAKRVSSSELYRLFASEVGQMDSKDAGLINDPDAAFMNPSDDATNLTEQVPLMRNVLLDFMNYNGLLDARLVNASGQTFLSALSRPSPVTEDQKAAVNQAIKEGHMAFGPVRSSPSGLALDFADPLRAVLSQETEEEAVAALLLTTPVTGQIALFLSTEARPGEAVLPRLLQQRGQVWEEMQVRSPSPVLVDSALIPDIIPPTGEPGKGATIAFGMRTSMNGESQVYSYGAEVPNLGWWLLLEKPASEINAALQTLAWTIFSIGLLASVGFVLLLTLAWWVVVGREQRVIAQRFQNLYQVINQQKRFLDSVNVSLEVGLMMADKNGVIQLCNRSFAHIAQREEQELLGVSLMALFDGKVAGRLLDGIHQVITKQEAQTFEVALHQGELERLYRATLYPFVDEGSQSVEGEGMEDTLLPALREQARQLGVVATFQDITEFRRNSDQRRRQQVSTVAALVRAIEGVDPYLAGHSQMMSDLGDLLGARMELNERDQSTIRTAASLSQVGKIFVSRELLTKTGKLTPAEQAELDAAPEHAYNTLKDVGFELPVPQALHEMYERLDGTGHPRHLQGAEIGLHARILAVLNSFSAMVSPRSYRAGMNAAAAIENMRSCAAYDQRVVDALEAVLATPEGVSIVQRAGNRETQE